MDLRQIRVEGLCGVVDKSRRCPLDMPVLSQSACSLREPLDETCPLKTEETRSGC